MIPKTNNLGEARIPASYERMIGVSTYYFNSDVIKKFMSRPEYKRFCKSYCENRCRKIYKPTNKELALFRKLKKGTITVEHFKKHINAKTNQSLYTKIGRLYAYDNQK